MMCRKCHQRRIAPSRIRRHDYHCWFCVQQRPGTRRQLAKESYRQMKHRSEKAWRHSPQGRLKHRVACARYQKTHKTQEALGLLIWRHQRRFREMSA